MQVFGKEDNPDWATSVANEDEANACVDIIIRLYKIGLEPGQIGVMSPFRLQTDVIKSKLKASLETNAASLNQRYPMRSERLEKGKKFPHPERLENEPDERNWLCKIGTIESYQSQQREVIIISTVCSVKYINCIASDIFLNDGHHFNSSISRAKWLLIVVGHLDAINKGEYLPELIANGKTDEIERWPVQFETDSPFKQETSLFKPKQEAVSQ